MTGLGAVLTEGSEELFRQVHPKFVNGDVLSGQVFEAMKKDQGLLSVNRSSMTAAKAAFERFLAGGFQSVGVVAVTVAECGQVGLKAHEDPLADDPSHAVIDYNGKTDGEARRARKQLALMAQSRGWRHRPAA